MTSRQRKPASHSVPLAIAVTFGFSALSLSGCGQGSQTPLPELTRIPRPLMNPVEQKRAIRELEQERTRLDAEAAKPLRIEQ